MNHKQTLPSTSTSGYRLGTPALLCPTAVPGLGPGCSPGLKGFLSPGGQHTSPWGQGTHCVVRCVCPTQRESAFGALGGCQSLCVPEIRGDSASAVAVGCPRPCPSGSSPRRGVAGARATVSAGAVPGAAGCQPPPLLSIPAARSALPPVPGQPAALPCLIEGLTLPQGFFPGRGKQGHIQPCSLPPPCARGSNALVGGGVKQEL